MADYVYLKNISGSIIKPVTDLAAINLTAVNGIAVDASNGGTIGIRAGYIESCVVAELTQPDQQATPEESYIEGGTMYTLLGGYAVSQDVPGQNPSPYKVPSEQAVRTAIDAYVATGGSDIVPGNGITVAGGSIAVAGGNGINVNSYLDGGVSVKAGTGIVVDGTGVNINLVNGNGIAISENTVSLAAVGTNGVILTGNTFTADIATVDDTIKGVAGSKLVDTDDLAGALSIGKAVDVTSDPHASIGTLTYTTLRGNITYAGAAGTAKIGFYDSEDAENPCSFPKFAPTLVYIFMADITNTGAAAITDITLGGTSLNDFDGTLGAAGTATASKRIAFTFNTADTGYITFTATASTGLSITNLREFEVTGCSADARKYIGSLSNPDKHQDFYLVDYDEVNPWTKYIDMQDSPAVTLMAGLAYKLNAVSGTHTLTTDVCPADYYGEDAHLKLFVGDTANVVFKSPLNLIDALTPNAGHNITVKYRDGQANAYVDDIDVGYVITVATGTSVGSMAYGITSITATDNSDHYMIFSHALDGNPVTFGLASNVSKAGVFNIIGNGVDATEVVQTGYVGEIACRISDLSWTTTATAGENTGHVFAYDGNKYKYLKNCKFHDITLSTTSHCCTLWNRASIVENCTFVDIAGMSTDSAAVYMPHGGLISGSTFSNISSLSAIAAYYSDGALTITNCVFDTKGTGALRPISTPVTISGSTFNTPGNNIYWGSVTFAGYNKLNSQRSGNTILAQDTVLDLSDNPGDFAILSGTVSVAGTASVIPYNKTEPITVYGTGNALITKSGKIGCLVTSTSATTASGTLYTALESDYTNIAFSPGITGAVGLVEGTTIGRSVNILGNGVDSTTLGRADVIVTAGPVYLEDLTSQMTFNVSGSNSETIELSAHNCVFSNINYTGTTTNFGILGGNQNAIRNLTNIVITGCTHNAGYGILALRSGTTASADAPEVLLKDSTISNCVCTAWPGDVFVYTNNASGHYLIDNCRFTGNRSVSDGGCGIVSLWNAGNFYIKDCYFNNSNTTRAIVCPSSDTVRAVTISGSTFAGSGDNIAITQPSTTLYLKGTNVIGTTVSGAGVVNFVTGSTVKGPGVIANTDPNRGVDVTRIFGATVTFDGITFEPATYGYRGETIDLSTGNSRNITFKNCNIKGTSSHTAVRIGQSSGAINAKYSFTGTTIHSIELYLASSTSIDFINSTVSSRLWSMGSTAKVTVTNTAVESYSIQCICTVNGIAISKPAPDSAVGTTYLVAGSTVNCSNWTGTTDGTPVVIRASTISVGSWDEAGTTWTEGGSVTVIPRVGDPVTISGHGTTLNNAGVLA